MPQYADVLGRIVLLAGQWTDRSFGGQLVVSDFITIFCIATFCPVSALFLRPG